MYYINIKFKYEKNKIISKLIFIFYIQIYLEGICSNPSCRDLNRVIIVSNGFCKFNLLTDKAQCPIC
jgi:hypothetical protein